jgi:hypothetical protein
MVHLVLDTMTSTALTGKADVLNGRTLQTPWGTVTSAAPQRCCILLCSFAARSGAQLDYDSQVRL